jgi:hypothetical protein
VRFETSSGDDPEALNAGVIEHANWPTQTLCHDRAEPEAMPFFGPEIGCRQNKIRVHHARESYRYAIKLAEPF